MADPHNTPRDEDEDIRDALGGSAEVPGIRDEFRRSLKDKVLEAYDERTSPAVVANRRAGRWAPVWATTVAVAILSVVLWPAGRAYSFEAMRSAVLQQAAMRLVSRATTGDVVGWYRPGGVGRGHSSLAAVEASGQVYWSTGVDRRRLRYDVVAGAIDEADDDHTSDPLLDVMALFDGEWSSTRSEHWDWEPTADSKQPVVTVSADGNEFRFGLDAESSLPLWVECDSLDERLSVEFRDPADAPASLASLGIPGDVVAKLEGPSEQAILLGMAAPDDLANLVEPEPQGDTQTAMADGQPESDPSLAIASAPIAITLQPTQPPSDPLPTRMAVRRWQSTSAVSAPADPLAMAKRVDERLSELWDAAGVEPVDEAEWHALHRRLSLDLWGRPPRIDEIRQRRGQSIDALVDEFLAGPEFAEHLANVWTRLLLPSSVDLTPYGGIDAFEDWLSDQFATGVGYDEIARQLLLAEGRVNESGPVLFYTALNMEPERLAKQTSRVFLGTQIDCAQCHDHPYDDWTQNDFWAFAAFFARISRPQGNMESLSSVLRVKDSSRGEVMFPNTETVVPPRFLGGDVLVEEAGSRERRKELAAWMTSRDNRQFARSTVNHVWGYLFGMGLVNPTDDFGPHNPPLDDVLLDELSESFAAGGFRLDALVRTIVSSDAYRQTSRSKFDAPERREMFAQREPKWLSAGQLYDAAMAAARGVSSREPVELGAFATMPFGDSTLSRAAFIEQFETPNATPTEYQAGIPQALSLMNGLLTDRVSSPETSQLLKALTAPFLTDESRLETVFLATVSRPPAANERAVFGEMLASATSETARQEVLSDIFWALLNSAEFATNH